VKDAAVEFRSSSSSITVGRASVISSKALVGRSDSSTDVVAEGTALREDVSVVVGAADGLPELVFILVGCMVGAAEGL
jgi:hypothetical protein